jgi:hypothetical protein
MYITQINNALPKTNFLDSAIFIEKKWRLKEDGETLNMMVKNIICSARGQLDEEQSWITKVKQRSTENE